MKRWTRPPVIPTSELTEKQRQGRSNRRRGVAFERRVRTELERALFYVVRAAGSRGAVDLVAVRADVDLFVQVKRERTGFPRKEWEEVRRIAGDHGAVPVLASADGRAVRWEVLNVEWSGTFRPDGKAFDPRRLQEVGDDLYAVPVVTRLVDREGGPVARLELTHLVVATNDGRAGSLFVTELEHEGRTFDLEGRLGTSIGATGRSEPVVVFRERKPARRRRKS